MRGIMANLSKGQLVIDFVMCDWITLTSFDDTLYQETLKTYGQVADFQQITRMQYDGRQYGSVFIGTADQSGKRHNMVQVSGAEADKFVGLWSSDPSVRCTRIDVQVTCKAVREFDMFAFAERQKQGKRTVGFIESNGLSTVYIGSWKSNEFLRVYQKSKRVIRFEVCYKGSKSDFLHRWLGDDRSTDREKMRGWLKHKLFSLNDNLLDELFGSALYGEPLKPQMTIRPESNTEKWIEQSVIPAIHKYANSHDVNPDIMGRLLKSMSGYFDQKEDDDVHS